MIFLNLMDIRSEITNKQNKIFSLENEINVLKNDIKGLEKKLYLSCDHIWIREIDSGPYGTKHFICKTCNINRRVGYQIKDTSGVSDPNWG